MEKNIDAAAHEHFKQRNKATIKEELIYCHDSIDYWPTIINEGLNLLSFFNIMEYTADRIENEIKLLL